jgi:hypothetical protein
MVRAPRRRKDEVRIGQNTDVDDVNLRNQFVGVRVIV